MITILNCGDLEYAMIESEKYQNLILTLPEGGITISEWKPFSQYLFFKELLRCAKAEKIHTCAETFHKH